MKRQELINLGVPADCCPAAAEGIRKIADRGMIANVDLGEVIKKVLDDPDTFEAASDWSALATAIIDYRSEPELGEAEYKVWGSDGIDDNTINQMEHACKVPSAMRAAIMPDGHLGYGLPIGGVLATKGTIIPYAVGVDIACRMKLSLVDMTVDKFNSHDMQDKLDSAIEKGTRFGMGCTYGRSGRQSHDVMDDDRWGDIGLLGHLKDKAWEQLGTSGSGNHFVEWGIVTVDDDDNDLGVPKGEYVALLSHSGSRGAGARVCSYYSDIARKKLHKKYKDFDHLAWLDMDSEEGQEYWLAMNLMGDYAAANHDVIHRIVSKMAGAKVIAGVENHHNFAWKENHDGEDVYVHRKGATPAGEGVLGIIPGSMGTPAFVVRGKGSIASMDSASHGAGRVMSRKQASNTFSYGPEKKRLAEMGVRVLSAGADEVPGVYKDIHEVMAQQVDLVDPIARFDPKIVKMCGDGSKAED